VKRYSNISLPALPFKPGQGSGSNREQSHSCLNRLPDSIHFSKASWQESVHYLYAVDLFNFHFWWEAHEVLELLWIKAGRQSEVGLFLQGIIQVSAALLKNSQSIPKGAHHLFEKGIRKLSLQQGVFLGIEVQAFIKLVADFLSGRSSKIPSIELLGL